VKTVGSPCPAGYPVFNITPGGPLGCNPMTLLSECGRVRRTDRTFTCLRIGLSHTCLLTS